jgi:hypothetical protein
MRIRRLWLVCLFPVLIVPAVFGEVKTEQKTKLEMPGVLGGIMKTFGGKNAREGVVSKTAVKGDRKMTINDDTAELIDLAQEKIYVIDMKNKSYTIRTFEEMRRQMQEAMAKAQSQSAKRETSQEKQPEFTVDFNIKESGEKKKINGYDAREVVMTITVHDKNKKPENGSMVLTSSMWLAPRIAAMKEVEEFDRRFAEKLLLPFAADYAQQMAPMVAMYPGLKEGMGKLQAEKVNMDGTSVLTVIRMEVMGDGDQNAQAPRAQQQNRQTEIPKSLGGLIGGLGRKAASKDKDKDNDNNGADKSASLMTINEELLSVSTAVADADVSVPAGFKEKK